MKEVSMYLAGSMSGISFEEQIKWRSQVRDAILYGDYDYRAKPSFFSPPEYYNFEDKLHKSEKEVMNFDLNRLRNSDLVIVNFDNPSSLGTMAEIAIAYENRIPIVGFCEKDVELHPWQIEMSTRICDNMREVVQYIVDYFLN